MKDIFETKIFLRSILNSLTQHVAVIDAAGAIRWVNERWNRFYRENDGDPDVVWENQNYIQVCKRAASLGGSQITELLEGLGDVLNRRKPMFYFEYPCHSVDSMRWFMMRITPLEWDGPPMYVVTHQDITERKRVEEKIERISLVDRVTGLYNRRKFDSFLDEQWRRARRNRMPVSLIIVDIDSFRSINNDYGDAVGDEALNAVARILENSAKRPDDLVAHYEANMFGVILGNTALVDAEMIAEKIRKDVSGLVLLLKNRGEELRLTVSAGAACADPRKNVSDAGLVVCAKRNLLAAKDRGRNLVVANEKPGF